MRTARNDEHAYREDDAASEALTNVNAGAAEVGKLFDGVDVRTYAP